LACQRFTTLPDSHDIDRVASIAGGLHHRRVGGHAKEVADVAPDALGCFEMVQFNLNGDIARDYVEPACEAKNG
jgi:hypothetical protein